MERFPSGQREQTVNLPSLTSMVRIHLSPPYADVAELADAHGSGPCESDFMQVQVLSSAPYRVFITKVMNTRYFLPIFRYLEQVFCSFSFVMLWWVNSLPQRLVCSQG